ncbi:MAG: SHOCT domain-containing protein [Pseudonocardia sp.]|nr:SHOCT domain-containing protein [Pseudonocardia sp.]
MPGLLRGIARTAVIAGTATAVSNRVSRRQAGRWARQDEQAPEAPSAPVEAGGGGIDDQLGQLERLGKLREQGVLSDSEFAEQKQRILGS